MSDWPKVGKIWEVGYSYHVSLIFDVHNKHVPKPNLKISGLAHVDEFVPLYTQSANPTNENWLWNYVICLENVI